MKDEAQSIGEILDEENALELMKEMGYPPAPPIPPEPPATVVVEPVSELETQILKLKVARDEHSAMLQEIGITLAQLLEQRRKVLQGRVDDLTQELRRLDAELGYGGQSAAKPRQKAFTWPAKKTAGVHAGGWNAGSIKPGSQTERLINVLKGNPAGEFSASDLENLSGVSKSNVNGCLANSERQGRVRKRNTGTGKKGSTRWSWIGPKQ